MINLLPESYKVIFSREYRWRVAVVLMVFVDAVIIIGVALLGPVYIEARLDASTAANQARSVEKKNDLHTSLITETATLSATLKALSTTSPTPMLLTDIMPIISADKTTNISITSIDYTTNSSGANTITLTLTGTATTRNSLAAFISALKGEKRISNVAIPISDYAADTNVPFTITITAS